LEALVQKYRPKRFEDVLGQDYATRYLSELIKRGQLGKNILLFGSVGSGKTTLARIYAKALNCSAPTKEGSPCGACATCSISDSTEAGFHELNIPAFKTAEALNSRLDEYGRTPTSPARWRTVFLDEAHSLDRFTSTLDRLLKVVEDPSPHVIYCFATTEVDRIPAALRSRLALLEVRPLDSPRAIQFLRKTAEQEKIKFDREALSLIAGLADGQPRDLLQRLDQVRAIGDVTLGQVRWIFGIDSTNHLVAYFLALGAGDQTEQAQIMLSWREDTFHKARLVQLFLLALYYNDLLQLNILVDPVIASIPRAERQLIIKAFRTRLEPKGIDVARFWREMMAFWPVVTNELTDAALLLRLTLFHQFVSEMPPPTSLPNEGPREDLRTEVNEPTMPARSRAIERPGLRPKVKPDPAFLSYDQVRERINTASFFTQAYGLRFNARITVWHQRFSCEKAGAAETLTSEFNRGLSACIQRKAPVSEIHSLTVQEHDETLGFCTRVIAHIPLDAVDEVESWLGSWRQKDRLPSAVETAVEYQISRFSSNALARQAKAHRGCVLWLCAGLNPKEKDWNPLTQRWEPLVDLLGIPQAKRRRAGEIGKHRRVSQSKSLGCGKLERLSAHGMPFISAFDMGAWNEISGRWEYDEAADRCRIKKDHCAEIKKLRDEYPPDNNGLNDQAFAQELKSRYKTWSSDFYNIPRRWAVWWNTTEV
jgi:DNA polymerase III subunit gamma/tau